MTSSTVRDAMVSDPRVLDARASVQEAGELLTRPEVMTILVVDGERLVGVVTPDVLVASVVAAGRDPRATELGEIAEPALHTLAPDLPLDDAYQWLEQHDVERVPVVEGGRLVGVLSRSALQRRLAEDEPPPTELDPEVL